MFDRWSKGNKQQPGEPRSVEVTRWSPDGGKEVQHYSVAELARAIAFVDLSTRGTGRFVSRRALNKILGSGSGDDGWIGMTWAPFEIDATEYAAVKEAYMALDT